MGLGGGEVPLRPAVRVPLRAAGLPEKNTFIQFPQERSAVIAPVGAFTTPANLAPNLGGTFTSSPTVHVLSPGPVLVCSPGSSGSPLRTPSTMCGSPVNLRAAIPQQPGFLRCVSDPTGGVDPSGIPPWQHYSMGAQLSSLAPAFQPHMAPLAQNRMAPGPLIIGAKLPPGALRGAGGRGVTDRPYLLPAPMLPAVPAPAPRVLKFSYTVPGQAPAVPLVPMKMGEGIENFNNNY